LSFHQCPKKREPSRGNASREVQSLVKGEKTCCLGHLRKTSKKKGKHTCLYGLGEIPCWGGKKRNPFRFRGTIAPAGEGERPHDCKGRGGGDKSLVNSVTARMLASHVTSQSQNFANSRGNRSFWPKHNTQLAPKLGGEASIPRNKGDHRERARANIYGSPPPPQAVEKEAINNTDTYQVSVNGLSERGTQPKLKGLRKRRAGGRYVLMLEKKSTSPPLQEEGNQSERGPAIGKTEQISSRDKKSASAMNQSRKKALGKIPRLIMQAPLTYQHQKRGAVCWESPGRMGSSLAVQCGRKRRMPQHLRTEKTRKIVRNDGRLRGLRRTP